jgi:hypothetical protein
MEPQDSPEPDAGREPPRLTPEEALRQLEARLDRASAAAERLLAEATARAAAAGATPAAPTAEAATDPEEPDAATSEPPPAGWQAPENGASGSARELELLIGIVQSVRDLIPPDLQQRLAEALRELLLAVRAVIDWYLDRVERRRAEPAEVEDIPIQ